ncbi:MAG: L,D-transpeptidase [Chlamydiales bacterium]|nr:L,D-transpeptidase [Chlamydiales bacterium]
MKNWQVLTIAAAAVVIGVGAGYFFSQSNQAHVAKEANSNKTCSIVMDAAKEMQIDRTNRLYAKGVKKLPFMETVTYTHHVPWLKGRSALINDYSRYYRTSSQFISRSLNNGQSEEIYGKVSQGDSFNVIDANKNIEFHLVVDLSSRYLHLYACDMDLQERYLLKIYKVGVGALDPLAESGCETPLGTYPLSNKVGIYKPGVISNVGGRVIELVQLYGTRHIPFGDKGRYCALQGNPWVVDADTGELTEVRNFVGQYATEGNIRLHTEDMEELFSIVTSRPTNIQIVREFQEAQLPGREVDF